MERETQINHSELTRSALQPKLKTEGIIFMPEPGGGEGFSITLEGPKPGIVEGAIVTRRPEDIKHEEAREAATQFIAAITEKPLKDWTEEELKAEFFKQGILVSKVSTERKEGWERVGDQLQPFGMSVINEAQTRGTDVNGWFLELVDTANNAGYSIRSIGADTNNIDQEPEENETSHPPVMQEDGGRAPWADLQRRVNEYSIRRSSSGGQRDLNMEAAFAHEIEAYVNQYPVVEAAGVSPSLLELATHFELGEKLINRIIFKAYEDATETNDYNVSMNLYAQGNLDTLLGYLSQQSPEKHAYYVSLKTAAQYFHMMNASLNSGNLEAFINIAERINYQHFELMQKIRGSSEVMRLYEQKYDEFLARNGRITTEGYRELKEEVEKAFVLLNKNGLVESEFANDRVGKSAKSLEDWEVKRALNVGRTFFSITFRSAEKIASGRIPRSEVGEQNEKRYASFPQEQAAKMMNWIQIGGWRFEIASPRGGMKYLEKVKNRNQDFMRLWGKKKGINRYSRVGGMNVNELEAGGMFGVSGIYSSWRIENLAYGKISIDAQGTTVRQWLDQEVKGGIPRYKQISDIKDAAKAAAKKGESIEPYEEQLLFIFNPIINNLDMGVGAVIKQLLEGPGGYKVRKKLWERTAEINLPAMIALMTSVAIADHDPRENPEKGEIPGEKKDLIEEIKKQDLASWDKTKWDAFMEKILLRQEIKIKRALGQGNNLQQIELSNDEQRIMGAITARGKDMAGHLADIVFPYVPFANDLPFEVLSYSGPGEEFYRRRTGGDLGSYFKAEAAFTQVMNNPGGLGVEETLKQIDQIIKGIESPQGTPDAQERVYPMFDSWFSLIMAEPWKRHSVIKGISEFIRKPTSLAQTEGFAGIKAPSLDPFQAGQIIDQALLMGLLNADLAKSLKKKEKLQVANLLWMLFKEMFYIPELILAAELGKAVMKDAA